MNFFPRAQEKQFLQRIVEPRKFIQVLLGPRQVGKSTLAKRVFEQFEGPKLFLSADDPFLSQAQDLNSLWSEMSHRTESHEKTGLLIIDEIHKYPGWEKIVKARWDEDTRKNRGLKVALLGSAPLLIQKGLSESLAGRFEVIHLPHWSYSETKAAFQMSLDSYLYFGGYPGALSLINDESRWKNYVKDSLIETTLSRDILLLTRIDKPALLRQLFFLACEHSGQILSYQKMIGQLQDAGNTTTLAHYLSLLSAVGFVTGLKKFTGSKMLSRSSSPKLQVFNAALLSATSGDTFQGTRASPEKWGRWVESAVGAHLVNASVGTEYLVRYWKEGNFEVDFILTHGKKHVAIEIKSGVKKQTTSGLNEIKKRHNIYKTLVVGTNGIPLEDFFQLNLEGIFSL